VRGNLWRLQSLFRSLGGESPAEIASLPAAPRNDTRGEIARGALRLVVVDYILGYYESLRSVVGEVPAAILVG
jgi:hypothetical protein